MAAKFRFSTRKSTRRGSLTLELVLILPIIFLMVALIYQVSVMLMTYQAVQSAAMLAAKVAVRSGADDTQVKNAVEAATTGWYFTKGTTPATTTTEYYFKDTDGEWKTKALGSFSSKELIGVQVKVTGLDAYTQYWLLKQFKGVTSTGSNDNYGTIIGTACGVKE